MKKQLFFILITSLFFTLNACSPTQGFNPTNEAIVKNFWRIKSVEGLEIPKDEGIVRPYFDFNMSNYSAYLICHIANGIYSTAEKNKLTLTNSSYVQRKCEKAAYDNFDQSVKSILNRVNSWKIQNNELILLVNDRPQIYLTPVPR